MLIYKTTSLGHPDYVTIFSHEMFLQFHHVVILVSEVFPDYDFSIMVGKITLVNVPKIHLLEPDKPRNVFIMSERLSDIVNLSACVTFCGVRKEDNGFSFVNLWRDVDNFPFWRLPDAMKYRFNKDSSPDKNVPANLLCSTVCSNMFWNDVETFIDWLSRERSQWNNDGLFS